jgi:hypothetical protein
MTGETMKKAIAIAALALSFILGTAFAAAVRDWHDLDKARDHIHEAQKELNKARAANNYDMAGHGVKAEELLRGAEREITLSIDAIRAH